MIETERHGDLGGCSGPLGRLRPRLLQGREVAGRGGPPHQDEGAADHTGPVVVLMTVPPRSHDPAWNPRTSAQGIRRVAKTVTATPSGEHTRR